MLYGLVVHKSCSSSPEGMLTKKSSRNSTRPKSKKYYNHDSAVLRGLLGDWLVEGVLQAL